MGRGEGDRVHPHRVGRHLAAAGQGFQPLNAGAAPAGSLIDPREPAPGQGHQRAGVGGVVGQDAAVCRDGVPALVGAQHVRDQREQLCFGGARLTHEDQQHAGALPGQRPAEQQLHPLALAGVREHRGEERVPQRRRAVFGGVAGGPQVRCLGVQVGAHQPVRAGREVPRLPAGPQHAGLGVQVRVPDPAGEGVRAGVRGHQRGHRALPGGHAQPLAVVVAPAVVGALVRGGRARERPVERAVQDHLRGRAGRQAKAEVPVLVRAVGGPAVDIRQEANAPALVVEHEPCEVAVGAGAREVERFGGCGHRTGKQGHAGVRQLRAVSPVGGDLGGGGGEHAGVLVLAGGVPHTDVPQLAQELAARAPAVVAGRAGGHQPVDQPGHGVVAPAGAGRAHPLGGGVTEADQLQARRQLDRGLQV